MGRRFAAALVLVLAAVAAEAQTRQDSWYSLADAASHNDLAQVESFVLAGDSDIDGSDSQGGRTPLDYAAMFDNTAMAKFLLAHGARVDARDKLGGTALHWAAESGSMAMLQVLIDAKADIDAQNRQGLTPLMLAADRGRLRAVEFLLRHGADPKKEDFTGRDARQWAEGKPAVLQALNAGR